MSNRHQRRHPPKPRPKAPTAPPIRDLVGWSLEELSRATGVDRITTFRLLRDEVRAGRVVRMECGERVLWARLGGGEITEVAR